MGNNRIFGYDSVDGKLVPNEYAPIVKEIFEDFAGGKSIPEISRDLYAREFHSRYKNAPCFNTIRYMLTNETYMGDKVLWKTTPRDLFTKKRDPSQKRDSINLPSDHEAIVDLETWNRVQIRLQQMDEMKAKVGQTGGVVSPLYGKLFCAKCGAPMTRRTYTSRKNGKYKAWICRDRLYVKNGKKCDSDIIKEEDLLMLIAEKLGWKTFDEERFLAEVERVDIEGKKVTVAMKIAC